MAKVYRTAKGQSLDIGSLLLQNENTRAVGNMNVNARGDKINSENKIIKSRNDQMSAQYAKVHKKERLAQDAPVYKNAKEAREAQQNVKEQPLSEPLVEEVPKQVVEEPAPQKVPTSGLAGAIAKARSVEQEEEKTARQMEQEKSGVKRI